MIKQVLSGLLHGLFGVVIPFWIGSAVLNFDAYSPEYWGLFILIFGSNLAGYIHGSFDA